MLLVRPIITYAAPIWWNISASSMEKIRKFERNCLRAALQMYRSPSSNYTHWYSARQIYDKAKIPRIDIFTLELTRNYLANLKHIDNEILKTLMYPQIDYKQKVITGYFPPQYFIYFDNKGLIQNSYNIPIIYHYPRHKSNKDISFSANDCIPPHFNSVYNCKLANLDLNNFCRLNKKYWWLQDNKFLDELKEKST